MLAGIVARSPAARLISLANRHGTCFLKGTARISTATKLFFLDRYLDLDNQSVLLPGPERIRASKLIKDPNKFVYEVPNAKIETVYDVLQSGLDTSNDGDCLGTRNKTTGAYEWLKYSEVILRSQHVGSGLIELGLQPSNSSFVGVFASNRTEFVLTMFACAGYSMIVVPLYDSLGTENVNFIIAQVDFPIVIANTNEHALNTIKAVNKFPSLKTLVLMDPPSSEVLSAASSTKIKLMTFDELEDHGKKNKRNLVIPKNEELFCVPYTSGTTGEPKGVQLTHKNVIVCVASLSISYGPAGVFGGTILSYLPPAHIYEIVNMVASLYFARRVAFYTGDVRRIFEEIRSLKPTIVPLVPRLMNALYAKHTEEAHRKKWKHYLLRLALSRKEKMIRKGVMRKDTIWDKYVFRKFQDALGGKAHMVVTTSAPVSHDVIRYFRCGSGCYVFEAYGQTEVLGTTLTLPFESRGNSVGPPLPCNHVKLVDVPEMNYFAENDEGEICVKGTNVFRGYYKKPKETKEAIDDQGWHHSGDIGRWLPNGALKIIDRKKHLFKLSQGEYIAPEKVENAYSRSSLVLQVYVDGFSDKDYIVSIVVPDPTTFPSWAKSKGFKSQSEQLLKDKSVRTAFLKELQKYGKNEGLNSLEQVRNLQLLSEPFSVANGLLTPTLKLKRSYARKQFHHLLKILYDEGQLLYSNE